MPCSDSCSSSSTSLTNFFMAVSFSASVPLAAGKAEGAVEGPCGGSELRLRSQHVAHREQRDLAGLGAGVDMPERALAEKMGTPPDGDHVAGGQHVRFGLLLEP